MQTSVVKTFFVTSFSALFVVLIFIVLFHEPPAKGLIFSCKFYHHDEFGYSCNILEQNLRYNMRNYEISISGSKSFRTNVKYVKFENAAMDFVPEEFFSYFKNLERLEIFNSTLEILDEKSFSGGVNLKVLHLERNNIKFVSESAFKNLAKLECLSLEDNNVEYLKEGLFINNVNLQYLNFKNNKINFIDENVFKGSNLKSLDLSENECVDKKFTNANLENLESGLSQCYKNTKNQELLEEFSNREAKFNELHDALSAEIAPVEEQTYFLNSLLLESSLTILLFGYVIRSLWIKLLRTSKNKKIVKED